MAVSSERFSEEIVDEKHDAAPSFRLWVARNSSMSRSKSGVRARAGVEHRNPGVACSWALHPRLYDGPRSRLGREVLALSRGPENGPCSLVYRYLKNAENCPGLSNIRPTFPAALCVPYIVLE